MAPEAARIDNLIALQKAAVEQLTGGYAAGSWRPPSSPKKPAVFGESPRASPPVSSTTGTMSTTLSSRRSADDQLCAADRYERLHRHPSRRAQDAPSMGPRFVATSHFVSDRQTGAMNVALPALTFAVGALNLRFSQVILAGGTN